MLGDISSLFWGEEVFNGAKMRDYSKGEGVNPRDFEKQIWEYDTLNILKEFSDLDLFFKGGTCVQSLLPLNYEVCLHGRFTPKEIFKRRFQSHTGSGKYKAPAPRPKVGAKRYYVEDTEIPGIQKRIAIQVFVRGRFIRR